MEMKSCYREGGKMYARVTSLGLYGLDGYAVTVEADTSNGLPSFSIVGLPDAAVSESRDRVRAVVRNCGFTFPVSRITVNLAPADKRKTGPIYDLPILVAILMASGQLDRSCGGCAFLGELSLDGQLRPVDGVLPMALAAKQEGIEELFLPAENAAEAAVAGVRAYGLGNVCQLMDHLSGRSPISPAEPLSFDGEGLEYALDFRDIKGQPFARRAAEIAAAGGHNLLLIGPAGSGKSMLARRMPSILPPLSYEEALECTKIHSVAGTLRSGRSLVSERPFRSPHHTVSPAGLTGGGSIPRPGEISLAHNGVLFLDELPEFPRQAMEVLRQPVEDGTVTISRASAALTYPCSIALVAAMNPCPCGNFGNPKKQCSCTPGMVERYLGRISGPLLDRIDLHVEMPAVDYEELASASPGEDSASIRRRVVAARELQRRRLKDPAGCNARIPAGRMREICPMTSAAESTLKRAFERLALSARAYDKILKVARTIADLAGSEMIDTQHIAEAVQYRALDKKYWQR